MELYFLRHGKAVKREEWTGPDERRPLSDAGVAAMHAEAAALGRLGLAPDLIAASPLERARRTAEIVAAALGLEDMIVISTALAPGLSLETLAQLLAAHRGAERILLVGHEPAFSEVIGELIGGARIVLRKGALARVDLAGATLERGGGRLVWLLQPDTLAVRA